MRPQEPRDLRDLYDSLSRSASGELCEAEARALSEQIASDPETAAAASAFERMLDRLAALPEAPPPRDLDDAVLGRTPLVRLPTRGAMWSALAATLLAALALFVLYPAIRMTSDPAQIIIAHGDQVVKGKASILAGDALVSLDGHARITVEPTDTAVREPPPKGEPMKIVLSSLGGAAIGAVVTVAVFDGNAHITENNGTITEVGPGERKVIAHAPVSKPASTIAKGAPASERIGALEAEVESLRQRLEEAEFTSALAQGQVARAQGEPSTWPDKVDAAYLPAAFEENLRAEIAKIPGVALHQLDCEEYPCVATLIGSDLDGALEDKLKALPENLLASQYPDAGVWMGLAKMNGDNGVQTAAGLAFMPEDAKGDDALRTRTDFRAGNLLRDLEAQLEGEGD